MRFLRGKFHRGEYYCKINVSKKQEWIDSRTQEKKLV